MNGMMNGLALDGAQGHRNGDRPSCDGEGQLVNLPPWTRGEAHGPTICKGVFSGLPSKLGSWREGLRLSQHGEGVGGPRMWHQKVLATADLQ